MAPLGDATSAESRAAGEGTPILAVDNLEVLYSGVILALKGVNLRVERGACTVLLGPNGAGKSTTLKAISGVLSADDGRVSGGRIEYDGASAASRSTRERVAAGLVHVVEGRKVLRHMTVEQNLIVGGHLLPGAARLREALERVYGTVPRLAAMRSRVAGYLSGGEQQLLLIGRGLMAEPRLMLVDEPSLGLAPMTIDEIFGVLARLKSEGLSLLIVEQNAAVALQLGDHGYVMESGRVMLEGPAERLRANEDIREFYLGIGAGEARKSYREVKHYRRRKRWLG